MILAIKTDNPVTEITVYDDELEKKSSKIWESGRELEMQILDVIDEVLTRSRAGFKDLKTIIIYQGPGSFTGLRIGFAVANTLAASLDIPIFKTDTWLPKFSDFDLRQSSFAGIVLPEYGKEANITKPKK